MSEISRKNLKRGGVTKEAQQAGLQAIKESREYTKRLQEKAKEDPYAAYEEMHAQMTKHMLKLLKEEAKGDALPKREVTDRLREYRALTQTLAEYHASKGASEHTKDLFARIDERLAQANFFELTEIKDSESD